ncbi:MAG: cell division protein FtsH [Candidatus Omnitrophica bacterium CG1_02_49_10]|nr:MAG: cell division protein FtsH [Candidatus Omnitrophica bacterium CG1_02_49_10]
MAKSNKAPNKKKLSQSPFRGLFIWTMVFLGVLYLLKAAPVPPEAKPREITYSEFYGIVSQNKAIPKIKSAARVDNLIRGEFTDGSAFRVFVQGEDADLMRQLRDNVNDFNIKPPRTLWTNLFFTLLGPLVIVVFFWFLIYRGSQMGGGGKVFSFGKSRARLLEKDQIKETFKDVAGVDEAKEELQEIIEFLKDPKKFQRLGGKIPKGVLLVGPPGCGKTLLAKAVSGESGVPFFSIGGSDFVEMFVGVGASRVRDLFDQAKKAAKAGGKGTIIFIDEIDAVGRQRFAGIGGGHDEREQTLNALLAEMDGFNTQEGVILIAATNRPDVLDPALLRPGRFDRMVIIDRPNITGREDILKVHTKNIKLSDKVVLGKIAQQTTNFSGADLANLVNEAALLAARRNREDVGMEELEESIERVMAGPQRKSRVINKEEKKIIAAHESGHTLVALLAPEADAPHKVSILPRGLALGYTLAPPTEDKYITGKKKLLADIMVFLGGRVSEELLFNEETTGARDDLEKATHFARSMVTKFGMSEKIGNVTIGRQEHQVFLGRDIVEEKNYSEKTAIMVDEEIRSIVDACYKKTRKILEDNLDKLKLLSWTLFEKEVLSGGEVRELLGIKAPLEEKVEENSGDADSSKKI